jgi:hypothetical protein
VGAGAGGASCVGGDVDVLWARRGRLGVADELGAAGTGRTCGADQGGDVDSMSAQCGVVPDSRGAAVAELSRGIGAVKHCPRPRPATTRLGGDPDSEPRPECIVHRVTMYPSLYVMIFSSQRLLPGIPGIISPNLTPRVRSRAAPGHLLIAHCLVSLSTFAHHISSAGIHQGLDVAENPRGSPMPTAS